MSVSVVCAYDINDTNDQSHDGLKSSSIDSISSNVKSDDSLKVNNTDLLKSSDNDKLSADTSGLQTLIDGQSAGTTLTLTKDYTRLCHFVSWDFMFFIQPFFLLHI